MRFDCQEDPAGDWLPLATNEFRHQGYAVLDRVLPVALVDDMRECLYSRHPQYAGDYLPSDSLKVGDRRFMITIELSGPFADSRVYANPCVLALLHPNLGTDAKLDNFGTVLSLAGAEKQHIHTDGQPLFRSPIDDLLPPHAVTVAVPLIEMNLQHGTTALYPGSHRQSQATAPGEPVTPVVPLGSCVMWDYRLRHGGTANQSTINRPILYLTYTRSWFQDVTNFRGGNQERLLPGAGFLESVSPHHRTLFTQLLG